MTHGGQGFYFSGPKDLGGIWMLIVHNNIVHVTEVASAQLLFNIRSDLGTVCHLSVCLSSVTFCIVAKRYVLAKNCLKEWIGNQGQKVDFLGWCHISTSGFASMANETAVFALFLPVQPSDRY